MDHTLGSPELKEPLSNYRAGHFLTRRIAMAEEPWEARTTEAWLAHQEDERFGAMAEREDRKNCALSSLHILGILLVVIVAAG
ncbi:MAG TPA: hypothetical protein VIH03_03310, partial [Nitrososphaerales archaeon]